MQWSSGSYKGLYYYNRGSRVGSVCSFPDYLVANCKEAEYAITNIIEKPVLVAGIKL